MKPVLQLALLVIALPLAVLLVQTARRSPPAPPGTPSRLAASPRPGVTPAPPALPSASGAALATPATAPAPPDAQRQFSDWTARFLAGDPAANLAQGEALAWLRRAALRELIQTNPAQALAQTVPYLWREALPARITRHFERQVDGRGDFRVALGTDFERQKSTVYREAEVGGETFKAFVFGRRETQVSQSEIPLHGIAIEDRLALLNEALRVLDPDEAAARERERGQTSSADCAVCAAPTRGVPGAVAADLAGETLRFCCAEHARLVNERWLLMADGGSGVGPLSISAANSRWTHGPKTVLYMRVNFPDDLTEPISETGAYAVMDSANDFYVEASYHATDLTTTVTPLVTVPQAKAWYTTAGPGALLTDAREAARRAGFDTRNYDLDIACHTSVPGFDWGGLGFVHGKGTWLQSAGVGVTVHELGHNYGLGHANWWNTTTNSSVLGPGTNVEYGNIFDTMGSGGGQFNAWFKTLLGWLPDPIVHEVGRSGKYRVHAFDTPARENGRHYAARVPRDSLRDYWLELRQQYSGNPWTTHGVLLNWTPWPTSGGGSMLLETTPGTPTAAASREDSAVVIGRTFSDAVADVHLTPLARGLDGTNAWVDVQINFGTQATNRPPRFTLEVEQTNSAPGSLVHFRADAADPDGDSLAYAWTFEDLSFSTNNLPWTFKRYAAPGEYLVRCVVSDLRGGAVSANAVVNVGAVPSMRVSGRVVDLDGQPLEGVRVDNAATALADYRGGYTDSAGRFVIVQPDAQLTLQAVKYGWVFTNAGWDNPLTVTSSVPAVNFIGVPLPTVRLAATTNSIPENVGSTQYFRLTRTGDLEVELQVQVYLSGSATLDTDFRLDPAFTNALGTFSFPAGASELSFAFQALDDNRIEGLETCTLTLLENDAYVIAPLGEAAITLLDNDAPSRPAVSVATGTPAVSENGMDSGQFIVTRTGGTEADLAVLYSVAGTATAGLDYPTLVGVVLVPAGSRTASFNFRPTDDKNVEPDETVIVTLTPQAAYTVTGSAATITMLDDDLLTVTITPTGGGAAEPNATGRFTVKREGDLSANLLVIYTVAGTATPGADYDILAGSIAVPAGAASADIVLTPKDDLLIEGDESVILTLATNVAYSVGTPSTATLFIRDNEKIPVLVTAPDAEASEPGENPGRFTVSRGSVVNGNLAVNLALSGSAVSGVDYVPLDLPVMIPDGASSVSLEVIVFDDLHTEYVESVILTLLPGTNYNAGNSARAVVTIADDDSVSVPAAGFTFTASSIEERLSPGVSVSLSYTSPSPATVEWRVLGGSAATNDYAPAAGVLSFAPGELAKPLPLQIRDNLTPQPNRTVRLVLFNPTGATLDGNKFHTYTILDDDTAVVSVTATVAATAETGGAPGNFRLTRTGATNASQGVNFQLTGTASAPADFAPLGTSAVIPAGAAFVDLPVLPVNDGTVEFSETVVLTLISAPGSRIVSPNVATVTINDDDAEARPLVTISSDAGPYAVEGGGSGEFRFTRSGSTTEPLTLYLATTGTASNGEDYRRLTNAVTIPAGQTSLAVAVSALEDPLVEGDETVLVALTARDTYRVAQPGTALVVLQDNDQSVRVNASDFTAAEPGTKTGEFTFTRFGTTNADVRVFFTVSGTASNGFDYVALSNSFVIPAGKLSAALPVVPLDDLLVEGPETVMLTLSANLAYALGVATTATVTIDDDEPMVTITATVPSVVEGSRDPGVFTITRTGDPKYDFTVYLAVGGTATSAVDYPPILTNILFTCGMMAVDLLVFPTNELVVEGFETVTAALVPNPAYTILAPSNAVVTITDAGTNLAPVVTITSPTVGTVFVPGTNVNILLEATVSDDDTNTSPNLLWTKISGPAAFAFGPTNTANTTASFRRPGAYSLRLTADDGVLTNYAEVRVIVGAVELLSTNLLHWSLDDGSGTVALDSSGAGRDGALTGAPAWETNGILGGALRLHGAGDGVRENAASSFLEGLSAFSLSLWLKPATTNSEQGFFTADEAGTNRTLGIYTRTFASCGQATNVIEATLATTEGVARYISRSGAAATSNGWQHLVLAWSNGLAPALFINGQRDRPLEHMLPLTGTLTNCPQFIVGRGPVEIASAWNGLVDDVRVFSRALDGGEIFALAALPPTNYGALVYAGEDVTIQLITPATLEGVVSDDGQPIPPGALAVGWMQASGPVPVTLTNASALTHTVQFTQAGEYVFWLVADDGQVKVFDDVIITVIEPTLVNLFASDSEAAELGPDTGEFALMRFGDLDVELAVNLHIGGIASNGMDYVQFTNVLVFAPGEDQLNLTVTPFLDHRIEGEETVTLTVVSNLAYSIGSGEATVTIQDSPYGQWSVARFTLEELTDPPLSSEGADFDHDGLVNLVEYAVNRDPKNADTNPPVVTSLETNALTGETQIVLTYTRRLAPKDVGYAVAVSTDLVTWQTGDAVVEELSATDDGNTLTETVKARVRTPFPQQAPQFVTVRVWLETTGP